MPYPSVAPDNLLQHLSKLSRLLSLKVARFTLDDLANKKEFNLADEFINAVLPVSTLIVKSVRTASFPSKDVHYSRLGGQTNVGLNLRDVIEKTWQVDGSSDYVRFMPAQIQEAKRDGSIYIADLVMGVGSLDEQDILENRKSHLADITKALEQAASKINGIISEHRAAWMEEVTKQITERHQQLLADLLKKKSVDEFLNS